MKRITGKTHAIVMVGLAFTLGLAGCADLEGGPSVDQSTSTREQAVVVTPEFLINGADGMPDNLQVTDLDLTVSEIRLEPMTSARDGLAYTTSDPFVVHFDVDGGQDTISHKPVELPRSGHYLVSIRLEPYAFEGDSDTASFRMSGFVADTSDETADLGKDTDGRPQPFPWEPAPDDEMTDQQAEPPQWTRFHYASKRAVFYTFDDVDFSPGSQYLTFSFDARDWGVEVADPISKAVRQGETTSENPNGVDVTQEVDSTGNGVDALIETGVVRTDRPAQDPQP